MTKPDADAFQKGFDAQLTKRILGYLKPYTGLAIGGLVLAMLTAAIQPLPTLI